MSLFSMIPLKACTLGGNSIYEFGQIMALRNGEGRLAIIVPHDVNVEAYSNDTGGLALQRWGDGRLRVLCGNEEGCFMILRATGLHKPYVPKMQAVKLLGYAISKDHSVYAMEVRPGDLFRIGTRYFYVDPESRKVTATKEGKFEFERYEPIAARHGGWRVLAKA